MRNRIFGDQPSRAGSESRCFVGDPLAAFPVSHSIKVIESDETLRQAFDGDRWALSDLKPLFAWHCLGRGR
jgi:hypothetical protein